VWIDNSSYTNHHGSGHYKSEFVEAPSGRYSVECGAVPTAPTLTATDNCGTATVTMRGGTNGTCDSDYSLARTWTATDECGLLTVHTQNHHGSLLQSSL
jgi:hypothetical protein